MTTSWCLVDKQLCSSCSVELLWTFYGGAKHLPRKPKGPEPICTRATNCSNAIIINYSFIFKMFTRLEIYVHTCFSHFPITLFLGYFKYLYFPISKDKLCSSIHYGLFVIIHYCNMFQMYDRLLLGYTIIMNTLTTLLWYV